ncbi:class I SAM-dependent methyltransferase [Sporolactobacillus sp. THM7-7]|nr:class I SAM-dependent methyltransferase [Sporolactobacillus sp. THM7-7]
MNTHRYIDFLAKWAVDSAHPGGRRLTEAIIQRSAVKPEDKVLDVGCGTGATSWLLAERVKADVTALDFHPAMVARARQRALKSAATFNVVQASAEAIPFQDQTFDWVVSESVTAFTDRSRSIAEYYRVLVPGGRLLAIEMTILQKISAADEKAIQSVYGVSGLLSASDWRKAWEEAGFRSVEVLEDTDFDPNPSPVTLPEIHLKGAPDEEALNVLLSHIQIMQDYKDVLSYRIYRAKKPE